MLPAFLITFREVIEATLIVATILGILVKLHQGRGVKTVVYATGTAVIASILLIVMGSLFGFQIQKLYSGQIETIIEGFLMILSSIFITWAVFFLHKSFTRYKIRLLKDIQQRMEEKEQKGLFILVFTAVFREGFEIALFLLTIYFSSNPISIFIGFISGLIGALLISFALFTSLIRLPLYHAFRITSILLILFAAGLLARGAHEFIELGLIPELGRVTIAFIPHSSTFAGNILNVLFGLNKTTSTIQLSLYSGYILFMSWRMFFRRNSSSSEGLTLG